MRALSVQLNLPLGAHALVSVELRPLHDCYFLLLAQPPALSFHISRLLQCGAHKISSCINTVNSTGPCWATLLPLVFLAPTTPTATATATAQPTNRDVCSSCELQQPLFCKGRKGLSGLLGMQHTRGEGTLNASVVQRSSYC